ncbi:MAG: hypothetical protein KDE33_00065 [Bacteroidetes bacterium]|nr:hypothetical protein [Bacteroidota bacterium]
MATLFFSCSDDDDNGGEMINKDFEITNASAHYDDVLEQIIMTINVSGLAGNTTPIPAGQLDGAPVLGYVFPTNLNATDVGFGDTEGILALALTSHPDFDDTPLWDENMDRNYANDGIVWHPHWVVLVNDQRVEGGLSVKQFDPSDSSVILPPTNPGMPMYMDSPGYQVINSGNQIKVVFPKTAVNNKANFSFDGVTALMRVNTSDTSLPMLGVYEVYDVASGDLTLPYTVN